MCASINFLDKEIASTAIESLLILSTTSVEPIKIKINQFSNDNNKSILKIM